MGYRVVLTAPATEMSDYGGRHAIPFVAGFPKPWFIPLLYLRRYLYRPLPREEGSVKLRCAPLGLRRIESALVASGFFRSEDIAIVHPEDVEEAIGPETRVVGISVKDPLGLGYVSSTYSALLGLGEPINRIEFFNLMDKLHELRKRYRFKIVIGGPGVWQLVEAGYIDRLGIDAVVIGEGEEVAPEIFARLARGEALDDRVVKGRPVDVSKMPPLLGASIYGAIEITRGCGRGCAFCSPTMNVKRSFPLDIVLRDIETNLRFGQTDVFLVTEDIFLYGSRIPWEANEDAIRRLISAIVSMERKGLETIQISHVNLAMAFHERKLTLWIAEALQPFTRYRLGGKPIVTTEVGIESGSPRVIAKYMPGKAKPYRPEDWPRVVVEGLSVMEERDWVALGTIIVGLPDETPDDAMKTLELVEEIKSRGLRTFLVPLIFVPLGYTALEKAPKKAFSELSELQLEIFAECWKHNVKVWGPTFFSDAPLYFRVFLKIFSRIYMLLYAKKEKWRYSIAREIVGELTKVV